MPDLFRPIFKLQTQLFAMAVVCLLLSSACTHKQVSVPSPLTPLVDANDAQLIAEVNRIGAVKSIRAKLDIQFQDTSFATLGVADQYRRADADVTVQRPGQIYIDIQFFVADIAQMTSDGEHFRVAVLKGDEKYKRFVKGTNNADYAEVKTNGNGKNGKQSNDAKAEHATVSALSNLRPQHLTDAFLIRPIAQPAEAGYFYSRSEIFEEEVDTRPAAKKGARVIRGYYLLEELAQSASGALKIKRRFWFDRVSAIRLARIETFDDEGRLDTEVKYGPQKPLGADQPVMLPAHIEITRRKEQYSISLDYQTPESATIDHPWNAEVFVLANKWNLPEVDLDDKKKEPSTP